MEFQKAMQDIQCGNLATNIAIYGTEHYLRQQLLDAVLGQLSEEAQFDTTRVDLTEDAIEAVLDEADSFSFFADKRVIIVAQAQLLVTASKLKLSDTQQQRLIQYLEDPNPNSIVIWLMDTAQLDKRKKLTKAFQKQTQFIEVLPLNERQLTQYVQQYLDQTEVTIGREAVAELLLRVQYQLSLAMAEVTKLVQYAQSGHDITVAVVKRLVPRTLETDVFELTNAVLQRKLSRAVQIYQDLILAKNEPIALHALLVSQFRLLIQTKLLSQAGYLEGDIAQRLGVHPYRVKLAIQSNRALTLAKLTWFYDILAESDFEMKTGVGVKDIQFDLLMMRFIEGGKSVG